VTPAEVRTYREGLGLSARALADRLGLAEERTVRRWEDGSRRVPEGVADELRRLDALVERMVTIGLWTWKDAAPGTEVALLRYRTADGRSGDERDDLAERDPAAARDLGGADVHGAAVRRLAEAIRREGGTCRIVWFDADAYDAWRGPRRDTAALRAAWAALRADDAD
jgi:transcriptional regulator with XRE-family HTH domain